MEQYLIPSSYQSDKLTNNEIGWKTEFFEHRLQWNGAIYRENWDNVQVDFFDPGLVGNIFYNTNGQNFLIKGIETSLMARVVSGFTVQGAASWNQSRQTNSPHFIDNNPASPNYGKPITQNCAAGISRPCTASPIRSARSAPPAPTRRRSNSARAPDTSGPSRVTCRTCRPGSRIPVIRSPRRARIRRSGSRRHQHRQVAVRESGLHDLSASIGVSKDSWYVNLFGENLSNSNASTFVSTDQFIVAQTPLRPRVLGAEFGYKF